MSLCVALGAPAIAVGLWLALVEATEARSAVTSLAFVPNRASKAKPRDRAFFRTSADLWAHRHGGDIVEVDIGLVPVDRCRQVVAAVEQRAPDVVAFFCHGLRDRLPQLGITLGTVGTLGAAIAAGATAPRVVLFACSTGDDLIPGPDGPPGGDGGFADSLRDAMVKAGALGVRVDAHDRAGVATTNPFVRRFEGPEDKEHVGGSWLVEPRSALWLRWRSWVAARGWLEFPLLTREEIAERI